MASKILIVGAGFAGAVVARELANEGYRIEVIDKREHIAGNAYDFIDENGLRIHRYGPHLFHTNNMRVVEWISQFTDWIPYDHKVSALLANGAYAPLPINRKTLEIFFNETIPDAAAAEALLQKVALPIANPANAEEWLYSKLGKDLTEVFFARYTKKMWGLSLSEMDPSVVKRLPIRFDDESRYFPNDAFQALPKSGYTDLFRRIFDHPNIHVSTSTTFETSMLNGVDTAFLSMPIDEFFGFEFGKLPYRSIQFHHDLIAAQKVTAQTATVNFTDNGPITRETFWHLLPGHQVRKSETITSTKEQPCADYENNNERYYPVKTADGRFQKVYEKYQQLGERNPKIIFMGRCGTYQYLDMHQVVNQTLNLTNHWLKGWRPGMERFKND